MVKTSTSPSLAAAISDLILTNGRHNDVDAAKKKCGGVQPRLLMCASMQPVLQPVHVRLQEPDGRGEGK